MAGAVCDEQGVIVSIVELQDVSFRYKSSPQNVLDDISFNLEEGQFTGLIGPTNAGKSTLCLVLNGVIPHIINGKLTGRVTVAGQNSLDLDPETVAKLTRHVGAVFQNPESQLFGLSVEEDIAFGPENLCIPAGEIDQIIDETLARVGLQGFRRRSPYLLSGGQKQRVAIASALAMRPQLLVLDEPISELDPVGKNEVMNIVRRLNQDHQTNILVADHDAEHIITLAQQILVIDRGRILAAGTPGQVFQDLKPLRAAGLKIPAVVELTSRLVERGLLGTIEIQEAAAVEKIKALIDRALIDVIPPPLTDRANTQPGGRPVALELRGVSFGYSAEQTVLRDISIKIYENDYVALVGANGSGKTTLARHLNGILRASSGQVLLQQKDLAGMRISDIARKVGYVYQNPDHQIFARTVYEEVGFGPRNLGISGHDLDERIQEALAFVGLTGQEASEPFFLGLGQRQRLAVASVLAMRPDVLVVDEPDTGQDNRGAEEMMTLIDRLHAAGKTIIIISHNMDMIAQHVQRVIAMQAGQIVFDAPMRAFFDNVEALEAVSLRPPQITRLCTQLGSATSLVTLQEAQAFLRVREPN
jgi:energy-coupling factor transport system ATP-binding protein